MNLVNNNFLFLLYLSVKIKPRKRNYFLFFLLYSLCVLVLMFLLRLIIFGGITLQMAIWMEMQMVGIGGVIQLKTHQVLVI